MIPKTRGDCENGERPCPHTGCRHHLADRRGRLHGAESCALDVAEQGGITLEAAGALMGCTRERIRQIEERALLSMRERMAALERPPEERRRLRMVRVEEALARARREAQSYPVVDTSASQPRNPNAARDAVQKIREERRRKSLGWLEELLLPALNNGKAAE